MKRLFQRGLLLAALTLGLVFHLAAQSTQMTIHLNNGDEHAFYLSEDDRVYFEENERLIIEIAATYGFESFDLADIRKITCSETVGTKENSLSSLSIFPNPVHDALMLRNLEGTAQAQLYALDGRLVKSFRITDNQIVDISELPMGMYLLKVDSKTLKLMKL